MVPMSKPVAEVCALAKKDLQPGDTLDQIGEYTYRAWVMAKEEAEAAAAIPCGLLESATVTSPIAKGDLITYQNSKVADGSKIAELRAKQDAMISALGNG